MFDRKFEFNLPLDMTYSTIIVIQNELKSMVSRNEVATISVLKVKAYHHRSQLSNVGIYPFHIYLAVEFTQTK